MSDDSLEVPEADAAEQQADAVTIPRWDDPEVPELPLEADPADVAEQAREEPVDGDEDYR